MLASSQAEFMRQFNDKHREQFNKELLTKSEDYIIEELKKVILACQRNRGFTIKVLNFTVIDSYEEIHKILHNYEKERLKKKPTEENRYDYISLKDSDVKLLVVDYYIAVHNEDGNPDPDEKDNKTSDTLRVYIEVPRVVNKYFYKIFGNYYTSTGQIIESTYNNSTSSSKASMVALKVMFMASRFYRYNIENSKELKLKCTDGSTLTGIFYQSNIFSKSVPAMKYLLGRYGIYELQNRLKIPYLYLHDEDPKREDFYTVKRHNIYVSVPKFIYDRDMAAQSLMYTICLSIDSKDYTIHDIFKREFWLESLGKSFGNKSVEKGLSILESLENIYDIAAQEHINLPEDQKKDIYDILIWVLREFSALRVKDNLDIGMKRIRDAEYIAMLYGMKIVRGILRISDKGNKVTLRSIERVLNTYPDFLLKAMSRNQLINCAGNVNDLDVFYPLKFTYKGVSGLGENASSIPRQYKQVHPSHIGRLDMNSVSASDPGLTGMLCPMAELHNGNFSTESEPNTWREDTDALINEYREKMGIQQALFMRVDAGLPLSNEDTTRLQSVTDSLNMVSDIMPQVAKVDQSGTQLIRIFEKIDPTSE